MIVFLFRHVWFLLLILLPIKFISLFIYNVKATHFFGIVSSKAILKGFRQIFVNPLTLSSGKNYLQANSMCFTGIKLLLRLFYCTVLYSLYICTVLLMRTCSIRKCYDMQFSGLQILLFLSWGILQYQTVNPTPT